MSANPINTTFTRSEIKITLKEITDLISVEHNKAMRTVDKLTLEASFGGVEKLATPTFNPNGTVNKEIETYLLTKKQAIAVGAKLNNTLLMKIVDRLEELESSNKPKSTLDLIIQSAQKMQELENMQLHQENRLSLLEQSKRLENWQHRHNIGLGNRKVKHFNNTSGIVGVSFEKSCKKWKSFITVNGKMINLGRYKNIEDAITTRKNAENKYFSNSLTLGDLV